jgi:menaquinol-cytochrome c reductase cytochrome b/c subunit
MSSLDQRRAGYKRYKEDVARRGKPFFPPAMFHDTVMSLVVVCVIIALACIWKYTTLLGVHYAAKADPGTTSFVPRPDWYFYFLFYLLRIFKWPETVIIGTIGIPTICLILLLGLPFVDTRMERRLSRRPVAIIAAVLVILSMGALTWKGATAKESLGSEVLGAVPDWAEKQGFAANEVAVAGAELFAQSCTTCHTYLGAGSSNQGAPDLSAIGASGQGVDFFERYVSDPSQFGNTIMPKFGEQLSKEQIHQIAAFLDASKGAK